MEYIVNRPELDTKEGSILYPFLYGKGDIEISLQINLSFVAPNVLTFFNNPSSVRINTNGHYLIICGYGINFGEIDYVDVSNIIVYKYRGDGFQMKGTKEYYIKNNTFIGHISSKTAGLRTDEAISSVKGAGSVKGEISWNLFSRIYKGILCGTGDKGDEDLDRNQKVYIHHNWFHTFERRAPYCRYGEFFIYNNIFENWHYKDAQTFCIWSESDADAYVLSNCFRQTPYNVWDGFPRRQFSWFTKRPWCMDQGAIPLLGGKIFHRDNQVSHDWIKIEGSDFSGQTDFPGYEVMTKEVIQKIESSAGCLRKGA